MDSISGRRHSTARKSAAKRERRDRGRCGVDGSPLHASPAPAAEGRQQEDEGRGRRLSTTTATREDFSSRTPGPLYNQVAGGEVADDAARLIPAA